MDREAIKSIIEKQKSIRSLALGKGLGSPDTRVDEVIAENAQETITKLEALIELPMHPDPEINKEVNADIREGEEADKAVGLPPDDFSEMFVSSIGADWLPTPENINRLPEPLRKFIHDIETKCDPGGDAQNLILAKDTIEGLNNRIKELEEACDTFEKNSKEAADVFEVLMRYNLVPAGKPGPTMAAIISDVLFEMDKVHTALGKFPGSKLHLAAEVRINEYRAMEEKYERMKIQLEEADKTVSFLSATKGMDAPGVAEMIAAALIIKDLPEPGRKAAQAFIRNVQRLEEKLEAKTQEHNRLVLAVKKHHDQKGDDRCWLDDATLYQEAGLQSAETALPGREEFLANCARFHESRVHPSDKNKYKTVAERISEAVHDNNLVWEETNKKRDEALKIINRKIERTVKDLAATMMIQRELPETKTVSGRRFANATVKHILPALKRLGWKPTKKEAQVGKVQRRAR
jgi:hypothetical protein